jgi:hypothetical protein
VFLSFFFDPKVLEQCLAPLGVDPESNQSHVIQQRLEKAALYLLSEPREGPPIRKSLTIRKRLTKARKLTKQLLEHLPDCDIPALPRPLLHLLAGGLNEFYAHLNTVLSWPSKKGSPPNRGTWGRKIFLQELALIYIQVTRKHPSCYWSDEIECYKGAFFEFANACLVSCGITLNPHTLASEIKRALKRQETGAKIT